MTREEFELAVVSLLTEIRDALTMPLDEPVCAHPEESRIDMNSMTEIEWICGACKHHYGPVAREKTHAAVSQQSLGA